ncbi:hypothetical protein PHLGIDRAFT_36001 [Phlebiopsis gigantea 11061_1 CR5-6]|uniref:Uncharacterized protein n=1 Tax=Phlebiopsis gigantea (strain 11061_1 CR5-6) TaxID=745531 RepID=A0A0C3RX32_PHLG1|nr:hypothetical protein PHLGIDRAFT_36001 [Phlebiopsis gigantea 11061_1 CR5-6]
MPPRRPRSTSNVSASNTNIARAPTASPQLKKQFALAQDSIYQNNLNVIKRRDPSVVSILDQFSHICLYNFNGKTGKWVREGYEGSIFIVEHRDAPNYSFFILNRLGTGDYCRRIYPEDDVEILGNYLMYRYYPDFTEKRLAMNLPYPLPPQFRPMFDHEFAKDHSLPEEQEPAAESDPPQPYRAKKGTSITLGIWQFPQVDRVENLKDVMLRLREYVKHGQPYPDQYRYGPGRPPPPHPPHGQPDINGAPTANGKPQVYGQNVRPGTVMNASQTQIYAEANAADGVSEVDKLFAKLQPSPTTTTMAAASAAAAPSSGSVQNWFAALTGQDQVQPSASVSPAITPAQSARPASQATPTRGLALLDSIFASVSHPADVHSTPTQIFSSQPVQPRRRLPPQPEQIQIVSPKPQSSALPQILTQNVISTLLGLGPASASSRASSAALSSNSSHRSANKRYEGDNELSGDDVDLSATATAALDAAQLHLGVPPAVQGDVTPRAPPRGIGAASPMPNGDPAVLSLGALMGGAPAAAAPNSREATPNRHPTAASAGQRAATLVPFTADSELWPYRDAPRAAAEQEADVVELDFSDTRALSDPSLFREKQVRQGEREKGEGRRRKSRKERERERKEAIEQSWDDPTQGGPGSGGGGLPLSLAALMQAAQNGHDAPSAKGSVSEHSAVQTNGAAERPADVAREALLDALAAHPKTPARDLSRKQFVQEVLSLIYTDSGFVDRLYEAYTGPARFVSVVVFAVVDPAHPAAIEPPLSRAHPPPLSMCCVLMLIPAFPTMGWFGDDSYNEYQNTEPHEAKLSHELIAAAASYEAAKAYEKHVEANGQPDSHAQAKEILAGLAGAIIDREVESRGLDFLDKEKAKRHAREQLESEYDNRYAN